MSNLRTPERISPAEPRHCGATAMMPRLGVNGASPSTTLKIPCEQPGFRTPPFQPAEPAGRGSRTGWDGMDPATPPGCAVPGLGFESCRPDRGSGGLAAAGESLRGAPFLRPSHACSDFPPEPALTVCSLRGEPGPGLRGCFQSQGHIPPTMVTATGTSTGPQDSRSRLRLDCPSLRPACCTTTGDQAGRDGERHAAEKVCSLTGFLEPLGFSVTDEPTHSLPCSNQLGLVPVACNQESLD